MADLRIEVNKEHLEVWWRLYANDARELRGMLDPGAEILISARVRSYLRGGGYERPATEEGDPPVMVLSEDRFTLDVSGLSLVDPSLAAEKLMQSAAEKIEEQSEAYGLRLGRELTGEGPILVTGEVGIKVREALRYLRAGLDRPLGAVMPSATDLYHEAEEVLSGLVGDPVWERPK